MEFVVGMQENLVLGYRRQHLAKTAGDKGSVQAAGTIRVKSGTVTVIDNNSGHFLPTEAEEMGQRGHSFFEGWRTMVNVPIDLCMYETRIR